MISVIIPAHNEANVIGATLEPLLPGVVAGEMEVIVVCNGCSDETASIVKTFGEKIKCIETPVASKTNALNLGDDESAGFPRVYLDADIVFSSDGVKKTAAPLEEGTHLAAAPKMCMDFSRTTWAVKSYYDVWQQLPYVQEGMIGTGVYALSKEGKDRIGRFPDIIADDGYVRALFNKKERTAVDNCYSVVRPPANMSGLKKIKMRSRLGRYELAEKFPGLSKNEKKNYQFALLKLLGKVGYWTKIPIYLYVNLLTRLQAKKYYQIHRFSGWERDETSREQRVRSEKR